MPLLINGIILKNERNTTMAKITYFGVSILQNDKNELKRENYALINKKSSFKRGLYARLYQENPERYNKIFEDESCETYTDQWCENHRIKCMENFDLNMAFFDNLSKDDFETELNNLIKKHRKIKQIFDLNDCSDMTGIYIMVLDKYKQVYIGQSSNIKNRILNHWSKTKQFDRLIFGRVDNSILSIDVFGALDTTRIYVYPTTDLEKIEAKLVKEIKGRYRLNRTGGGILGTSIAAQLQVVAEAKHRDFDNN